MIESVELDAAVEVGIAAFCAGEEPLRGEAVIDEGIGTLSDAVGKVGLALLQTVHKGRASGRIVRLTIV